MRDLKRPNAKLPAYKMLEDIRKGISPDEAYKNNMGTYGRFDEAAKYIDPREE